MTNRVRRWACGLLVLPAIAVAMLPASSASAAAAHHGSTKHSLSYYNANPCQLITQSEAAAVLGLAMTPGITWPNSGQCNYIPKSLSPSERNKDLDFLFLPGTAPTPASIVIGKVIVESSVGHGAVCADTITKVTLFVNLPGHLHGKATYLNIATNTCPHAVTFAEEALSHIS